MTDSKPETKKDQKGYFLGEAVQETPQGRMIVDVIAKPDGTALTSEQVLIELLNNQLKIMSFLQKRL